MPNLSLGFGVRDDNEFNSCEREASAKAGKLFVQVDAKHTSQECLIVAEWKRKLYLNEVIIVIVVQGNS